jgi:hypothetical protein
MRTISGWRWPPRCAVVKRLRRSSISFRPLRGDHAAPAWRFASMSFDARNRPEGPVRGVEVHGGPEPGLRAGVKARRRRPRKRREAALTPSTVQAGGYARRPSCQNCRIESGPQTCRSGRGGRRRVDGCDKRGHDAARTSGKINLSKETFCCRLFLLSRNFIFFEVRFAASPKIAPRGILVHDLAPNPLKTNARDQGGVLGPRRQFDATPSRNRSTVSRRLLAWLAASVAAWRTILAA